MPARDMSPASTTNICWRVCAATLALLLTACGGGGGGDGGSLATATPTLSGRVTNGATPTDIRALQITVKGNVGTARTAEGRLTPVDGGDYLASLSQLSGPYLISDSAGASSGGLYSVATAPGVANLTPLTTLLVAQLLGAEPHDAFAAQGARGGFTAADDASIAAAEQQVRRYLKREFGFEVPNSLGAFVTAAFSRVAGDPMYDTLTALVARIGTAGDYSSVVTAVAQESARCKVERVRVQAGATVDDFCPFSKSNEPDANDSTVQVLSFTNRHGDTLTLQLRGTTVLRVQLTTAEGATSACNDAACTGITLGTPAGDLSQTIAFSSTPLAGSSGSVMLTGSLRSGAPGIPLPGVPCTSNRFYLIHEATRTAEGYCAPDDFGIGASGQSLPSGTSRRTYTFNDGVGGPSIEVVTQGTTLVRALVYTTDPDTGAATPRYQCRGGGCVGVTLGATTVDQSLGVPIVLQPIRFDRAVLASVLPDGSLSATDAVTVEATLTGYHIDDPSALPLQPLPCAPGAPVVASLPSDRAQPIAVCEPADTQGFTLRSTFVDDVGNLVMSLSGLLTDGAGGYASGNAITVTVSPAAAVLSVTFDEINGPRYQCSAAACTGILVSAPNGNGERTISFSNTSLQEMGTGGLVADRVTLLNGTMLAAP